MIAATFLAIVVGMVDQRSRSRLSKNFNLTYFKFTNQISHYGVLTAAAVDNESLAIASADVPLSAVAAAANDSIPLTAVADGYDQPLLAAGDYVPAADDAELLDG